jgi:hypothetical protein
MNGYCVFGLGTRAGSLPGGAIPKVEGFLVAVVAITEELRENAFKT